MPTKIPWATETWNPVNGCTKISEGCKECYAEKLARRLKAMGIDNYQKTINEKGNWSGDISWSIKILNKPFQWEKPRMIFVCSMGDLFHEAVPTRLLMSIFEVIEDCPQHTFLLLTKRPENALAAAESLRFKDYFDLPNIWMGVTAENQAMADKRIPILLKIPAAKRFVSIEPMLEPVDLTSIKGNAGSYYQVLEPILNCGDSNRPALDWVIAGCESGTKRRPMDIQWVRDLKNQCVAASVPFFFKQKYIGNKKISMPMLDDQIWDQYPQTKPL